MGKRIIKEFNTKEEAQQFMVNFVMIQQLQANQLDYINEAVEKSNLKEAKEVIQRIMELK
jgi:hypothetical protein